MESIISAFLIFALMAGCSLTDSDHNTKIADQQNVFDYYKLPPFNLMSADQAQQLIDKLMVVKRVKNLKIDPKQFQDLSQWQKLYDESIESMQHLQYPVVQFTGNNGTALNTFLAANREKTVRLTNDIETTETIVMPSSTILDGGNVVIKANCERVFSLTDINSSAIMNLRFEGNFSTAVYLTNGQMIMLKNLTITKANDRPIVVMGNTHHLYITDNIIEDNKRGGIYIRGGVNTGLISNNTIRFNHESSNFTAGIVITHFFIEDINDPEKADFRPIDQQQTFPHDLLLIHNRVTDQQSSGIYVDGAISLYIIENYIADNDKEGTCLDNGTTGVHFMRNTVMRNGRRFKQSDRDLEIDFVLKWGRMPDGSSKSKLPGISIDNALYNIIVENSFIENYGSGIKMVRTGVRNIIGDNTIADNNAGENDQLHFYGIELGSAPLDADATFLDATADYENIIFSNRVSGSHRVGIFLAGGTYQNNIFKNVVLGAKQYSIESSSALHNYTHDNQCDVMTKGISEDKP